MIIPPPIWARPPDQFSLGKGEIHIWRANLHDRRNDVHCLNALSPVEHARAARFVFEKDRLHYIASRGALRHVLSRYTGTPAAELCFSRGPHGKPALVQTFTDIRFNLSHSGGLAIIAVAQGSDIGVDVEQVYEGIQYEEIASHYFEPDEQWHVRTAPSAERVSRFFEVWTRKEATLKAIGCGLGGEGGKEVLPAGNFIPAAGYAAALATPPGNWRLACWEFCV